MSQTFDTRALLDEINKITEAPNQKHVHSKNYHDLNSKHYEVFKRISKAHIDSFNFMIDDAFPRGIQALQPLELELPGNDRLEIRVTDALVGMPLVHKDCNSRTNLIYPSECRMKNSTYKAKLTLSFSIKVNKTVKGVFQEEVGEIPIMVMSKKCNISNLNPKQLVQRYEDAAEFGGYFIVNGKERIIRFLTAQRRNYPMAMSRKTWIQSGHLFTEYGVSIRCVSPDQLGSNMVLHYLSNGTAKLRFFFEKQPVFIPLVMVLKGLCNYSDQYIYMELVKGKENDSFYCSCVMDMLRYLHQEEVYTHADVKKYIGERLRIKTDLPDWYTDEQVTDYIFKKCVAIHLNNNTDKFNLLVHMTQKLFAVAQGKCALENADNPMFHELYLSGHIYFTLLLERIEMFLSAMKRQLKRTIEQKSTVDISVPMLKKMMSVKYSMIWRPVEYLITTGNLQSKTGLGLMQTAGISVVAEKINFWRFISHFRAVHRGAYFTEMKTTACRKLYPEAWGFLCPVHTPDGTPCGLLNHMSDMCIITNKQASVRDLLKVLVNLGMEQIDKPIVSKSSYITMLDGKILGFVPDGIINDFVEQLRALKATAKEGVDSLIEIGFIPKTKQATQYPGLFLFSNPARMMRPVFNLKTESIEIIGSFEQVYLDICVVGEELIPNVTTHQELTETCMLSLLASQIPFSDFNQSPRNMYCCQMGKQTMGTPSHTLKFRSDQKMYSINSPQTPLVRSSTHDYYHMDDYPFGTNAVVAVISYTGYDMEDALVLNKASVERGFGHGNIQKTVIINLREIAGTRGSEIIYQFGYGEGSELREKLDADGLPFVGSIVEFDDPICSYYNIATREQRVEKYKSTEVAFITDVKILGNDNGRDILQKIAISFYIPRRPIMGDKFANRHGQKGICSILWPQESMPFTEGGLTPDIIFNPHGYPSRMTIGMMIETLAGKSGANHGVVHDCTPFMFSEDKTASDYYGKLLEAAGYNYFGTERMYSGVDGRELKADIFVGVIYYIRLRHMVGDKYQVRSTGPVDQLTRQPVQGRKRCGGIRFGEMERDSLLSHGVSFLLRDRLFNQSDESLAHMCSNCGSMITIQKVKRDYKETSVKICRSCKTGDYVKPVSIPYVLQYLAAELATVNIKMVFDLNLNRC